MIYCSRLDENDERFKRLYLDKTDMQYERKLKKFMEEGNWFQNNSDEDEIKLNWRDELTSVWKRRSRELSIFQHSLYQIQMGLNF